MLRFFGQTAQGEGAMSDTSVISAFSAEHVSRITGLTTRQLVYWEIQGFFQPAHSYVVKGSRPVKVYSFNDVVGLRVISVLINEYGLSLQYLRKVAAELESRSGTPWSSLTIGVCKGEVVIFDRTKNTGEGLFTGQYHLVPIIEQIRYVQRAISDLNKRQAAQIGTMEKHRNVAHNARVFAGTRIPVKVVYQFLDAGYDIDAILQEYPSLEHKDIEIAIVERNNSRAA
jgi:uncharacterized protein (DUF433 family)